MVRSPGAGPPQHLQDSLELNFYPKSGFSMLKQTTTELALRGPRDSQSLPIPNGSLLQVLGWCQMSGILTAFGPNQDFSCPKTNT